MQCLRRSADWMPTSIATDRRPCWKPGSSHRVALQSSTPPKDVWRLNTHLLDDNGDSKGTRAEVYEVDRVKTNLRKCRSARRIPCSSLVFHSQRRRTPPVRPNSAKHATIWNSNWKNYDNAGTHSQKPNICFNWKPSLCPLPDCMNRSIYHPRDRVESKK